MRKILSALILLSLVIVPMVALAQEPIECCKLKRAVDIDTACTAGAVVGPRLMTATECVFGAVAAAGVTTKWGICCLFNTINTVIDWISVILFAVAVIFVILGAMNIMLAGGDPEKFSTGRSYIMYAAIGLIVVLLARVVPSIIKMAMGY